jgi:hypothetical protein
VDTGLQREDRQVQGEYRLTEREQTGQRVSTGLERDITDRSGVNTGSQKEDIQVRGE